MSALIITDLQNDFCDGGALAVPGGDDIVPVVNRLQEHFDLVVATQDWHPFDHASFALNHRGMQPGDVVELAGVSQVLWPVHCVQHSHGAEFHPALNRSAIAAVFQKGTDSACDSYSAFFDNFRRNATGLCEFLRERAVESVCICGLATDYCVKFTAIDALRLGFRASVVIDACRGVNRGPGDEARAIDEMRTAGAAIVQSELLRRAIH